MYAKLLAIHGVFRWLVLLSLVCIIFASIHGLLTKRAYTNLDKLLRIITGAIGHTQLLLGLTLYFALSPLMKFFVKNGGGNNYQMWFFGIYHIVMMFSAIVVMAIGSALSKKVLEDKRKFKMVIIYFSVALGMILLSIPWFRPFFRNF